MVIAIQVVSAHPLLTRAVEKILSHVRDFLRVPCMQTWGLSLSGAAQVRRAASSWRCSRQETEAVRINCGFSIGELTGL